MKKIRNERGETLVEVLASIIIASLSVALMFGCIMVSTDMDKGAKVLDEQHYLGLTTVDAPEAVLSPSSTPGTVTIKRVNTSYASDAPTTAPSETPSADLDITIYEGAEMSSYRRTTQ